MVVVQWQVYVLAILMTWVRDPGPHFLSYFSSYNAPMQLQRCGAPYAFIIYPSTRPASSDQRPWIGEHHTPWSTHVHAAWKSQTDHVYWARFLKITPPYWGLQPPRFVISFYFILFLLIISC